MRQFGTWDGRAAIALAGLLTWGTARAAEPPPVPADPATLAEARAVRTLPCAGGPVPGFAAQGGTPAAWHVAGATVSVRLAGDDRFAFVLGPPGAGGQACPVRDVLVLPRGGMLLQCPLPDRSSQGLGVHGRIAAGGRDVLFWRGDGAGGLLRPDLDAAGLGPDTGELVCPLPDAMP